MRNLYSRRAFIRNAAVVGAGSAVASSIGGTGALAQFIRLRPNARLPARPLNPALVAKFVNRLVNPLGDAPLTVVKAVPGATEVTATLKIQQASQSLGLRVGFFGLLQLPKTTVWGYNLTTPPDPLTATVVNPGTTATYPGPTFVMHRDVRLKVTFENDLQANGQPLPFPANVPVDTTLDWANPGSLGGTAPIPVVTHLHGSRVNAEGTLDENGQPDNGRSDGGPDGWSTPDAIAPVYTGPLFTRPYTFNNDQEAGFLWYHDHALGITRTNVYMGLAGICLLRDNNENMLINTNVLPSYPYEVPLVIQDRMFQTDGSLFYPNAVVPTDPALPTPTHLPEFFGDIVLVNTLPWPRLDVERRKYRLRLLNGSDSRFYELSLQRPNGTKLPIWVIGNELGLLNKPEPAVLEKATAASGIVTQPDTLLIGPGERYDVIVDFSSLPFGTLVTMRNTANSPYPDAAAPVAGQTDRVMMFAVVKPLNRAVPNASVALTTPLRGVAGVAAPITPLLDPPNTTAISNTRQLFLFEGLDGFGRLMTMLGVVGPEAADAAGTFVFKDPITEQPHVGTSEVWEFYNTTVDAHPIHMHLVDFRVIDRQPFTGATIDKTNTDGSTGAYLPSVELSGTARAPQACESGRKDTVVCYPGEVTRVVANFHRTGEYVYHCHILSHEDHEMMRRYVVIDPNQPVTQAQL